MKKPSNVKVSCFLYHLSCYFKEVGNRRKHELISVAHYLSQKPEQMAEVSKIKADLVGRSMFTTIEIQALTAYQTSLLLVQIQVFLWCY